MSLSFHFRVIICLAAVFYVVSGAFRTNLVQGGDSTVSGAYNHWSVSSDCKMSGGDFSIVESWVNDKDCYMTQTIDITFTRNYLLNPGGRVMISMQGYIEGGSPDYASLTLNLLECISGNVRYTLGGNQITSSSWNTYNWGMRLPPNICTLAVQLYLRNHAYDGDAPSAQTISVTLTETPATTSAALSITTSQSASQGGSTPTLTLSAGVSLSALTWSRSVTFDNTATSSHEVTKSLSVTSTTATPTETFGLVTLSQSRTRTQSANDSSVTDSLTATAASSYMSPSLDVSPSASHISCSRLDKVSLVYDPTMMVAPADGNMSTTATISDHSTFEIIAASVDRRIILTASVVSASFDFGDHTRWTIVQANVVSDESLVNALSLLVTSHTVVSNGVAISLSSSNVTGSSDSIPWIPHGLSIYGSTTVELQLQLQCTVIDAVRNETFRNASTLALRLPSPGISLTLSPQLVSVVVARSQLIGSVAGVGAASGSARLASITVAQCGADNNGVSGLLPISVAVPSNCNFTSPYLDDINAIAGNWVVVLVGTAAAVIACAVLCLAGSSSFVDAMRLLTFPLCVLPQWVAAAPSSGAAAIHLAAALLVSGDEECTSVFVVVIGAALLLVITVISGVLVAVWIAHKHFTRIDVRIAAPIRATSLQMCMNLARWSLANSCEWKMLDKSDAATRIIERKLRPTRHIDALLSEFRVVGYSVLDLVNTVIVSLIAGAALGAGTFSWCIGSLAFSLALFCVQLCICIALRPHITWFYSCTQLSHKC